MLPVLSPHIIATNTNATDQDQMFEINSDDDFEILDPAQAQIQNQIQNVRTQSSAAAAASSSSGFAVEGAPLSLNCNTPFNSDSDHVSEGQKLTTSPSLLPVFQPCDYDFALPRPAQMASTGAPATPVSVTMSPSRRNMETDEVTPLSGGASTPLLRLWSNDSPARGRRLSLPFAVRSENQTVEVQLYLSDGTPVPLNIDDTSPLKVSTASSSTSLLTLPERVFNSASCEVNPHSLKAFRWNYTKVKGKIKYMASCKSCHPTPAKVSTDLEASLACVVGVEAQLNVRILDNGNLVRTEHLNVVLGIKLVVQVPDDNNSNASSSRSVRCFLVNPSNHSSQPCIKCKSFVVPEQLWEQEAFQTVVRPKKRLAGDPSEDDLRTPPPQPQQLERSGSNYSDSAVSPELMYSESQYSQPAAVTASDISMQCPPLPPQCGSPPRIDLIPCRVPSPSADRVIGQQFRALIKFWRDRILSILKNNVESSSVAVASPFPTVVLVVHGMGGIGKSTFARSLATSDLELPNERFPLKMELPCESDEARDLTIEKLKAASTSEKSSTASCEWLRCWLSQLQTGWLLVADNMSELERVTQFVPHASESGGCVIITTRTQPPKTSSGWYQVSLSDWSQHHSDSIEMIRQNLQQGPPVLEQKLLKIANAVGHLPLAMQHIAASFSSSEDVDTILRLLESNNLSCKFASLSSALPNVQTVMASMGVSIDRVRASWQKQAHMYRKMGVVIDSRDLGDMLPLLLLRIGAYLGSDSNYNFLVRIFVRLISYARDGRNVLDWKADEQDEIAAFQGQKLLIDVSLVKLGTNDNATASTLSIHRLVQEVVRQQFEQPRSEISLSAVIDPQRWLILLAQTLYDEYSSTRDDLQLTAEEQRNLNEPMLSHMLRLHHHLAAAKLDNTDTAALLQFAIGQIRQFHQSDVRTALPYLEHSYRLLSNCVQSAFTDAERDRLELERARVGSALGNALRSTHEHARARAIFEHAVETQQRLQSRHWELANVQVGYGKLLLKPERFPDEDSLELCKKAEFVLRQAVTCFEMLRHQRLNWAQLTLGECLKEKAKYQQDTQIKQEHEDQAGEAMQRAETQCDQRFVPRIFHKQAELCLQKLDRANGLLLCQQARASYTNLKFDPVASVFQDLDQLEESLKSLML